MSVDNRAMVGKSSRSFIEEGRWAQVARDIQAGDYVLIQFGHNDQRRDYRYTSPTGTYPEFLARYVLETRQRGGTPILVTPVVRRHFNSQGTLNDTHGDYPDAMRRLAEELEVPLIDLHQRSFAHVAQLGEAASKELFLWLAPGEVLNYPRGIRDNTYFSQHGAQEVAKLVAEEIEKLPIPLKNYLKQYAAACREETTETVAICAGDSVYLEGRYQTLPGNYQTTYQGRSGCDSVVHTQLIVHSTQEAHRTAFVYQGDSVWLGQQYRHQEGTYYDTLVNSSGCDSVIATFLTVVPPPVVTKQTLIVCEGDSLLVGERYHQHSGTYYDTLVLSDGTRQVTVTTMEIQPRHQHTQTVTLCAGESMTLRGIAYTQPGTYYDTLKSSLGCDSVIITTLQILKPLARPAVVAAHNELRSSVAGDTYRWLLNGELLDDTTATLTPFREGDYSVAVSSGSCLSLFSEAYHHMLVVNSTPERVSRGKLRVYRAGTHALRATAPGINALSATLYIHDLLGNCVYQRVNHRDEDVNAEFIEIPFAQPEGVYTITLVASDQQMSTKFYWIQ